MSQPNRQTISFLNRRFREVGLEPNKRHGQNFLVDLNLVQMIADTAQLTKEDVVLEVGTGTGSLTGMMAAKAGFVISAEIDQHLHQLASEELEDVDNVQLILQDALKNKSTISPVLLDTIAEKLKELPGSKFKLAANLPYNIATPLISNLLMLPDPPHSMSVTIQKELGDRMMAQPSTKDYSALSIWMQAMCDIEMARVLPPNVFWPAPKVDSAIMHIVYNPEKRAKIKNLRFFHKFVRALFFHRRKFLRSVVCSAFKHTLSKAIVDEILESIPFIETNTRAENLPVSQLLELCDAFDLRHQQEGTDFLK